MKKTKRGSEDRFGRAIEVFKKHGGVLRITEATNAGIHPATLYSLRAASCSPSPLWCERRTRRRCAAPCAACFRGCPSSRPGSSRRRAFPPTAWRARSNRGRCGPPAFRCCRRPLRPARVVRAIGPGRSCLERAAPDRSPRPWPRRWSRRVWSTPPPAGRGPG